MERALNRSTHEPYGDVVGALGEAGLQAVFTQTGGGNAALEISLEGGYHLLITDAEDGLSWERPQHQGWGVGLYRPGSEYDDGPLVFKSSEDGEPDALLPLIRQVLESPG